MSAHKFVEGVAVELVNPVSDAERELVKNRNTVFKVEGPGVGGLVRVKNDTGAWFVRPEALRPVTFLQVCAGCGKPWGEVLCCCSHSTWDHDLHEDGFCKDCCINGHPVRWKPADTKNQDERFTLVGPKYRTPDGEPTCAISFPEGKVCPFFRTQRMGSNETCVFAPDAHYKGLTECMNRRDGGGGLMIPGAWCPVWHGTGVLKVEPKTFL